MKRWVGIACLGAAALFAAILLVVFYLTKPIIDSSESFLTRIAEHKASEAYASASQDFRASLSQAQFEEFCKRFKLDQYQPGTASWGNRRIRDANGWVSGSFTPKGGEQIPLRFLLHYEDGNWKVSSIQVK